MCTLVRVSKWVDFIGPEDCGHLQPPVMSEEDLEAFYDSLPAHEREARRTGKPSLGSGAVYQVPTSQFVVEPYEIPDWWQRAYGFDVGWKVTAGIFGARNPENGRIVIFDEYFGERVEPIVHAHAMRVRMPWDLYGAIDPAAEHSNQKDGRKLKEQYESLGLRLVRANNALEAGIHKIHTLLQTGMLEVFSVCQEWLKEYRLYRRKGKEASEQARGKVVKQFDHCMDATRYMVMTEGIWTQAPASRSSAGNSYGEF